MDSKNSMVSGFRKFMEENPVETYGLLSVLHEASNAPKNQAMAQQEIAKTIASPWLGTIGDMSRVENTNYLEAAMQGATAGYAQKKQRDREFKLAELLKGRELFKKPNEYKRAPAASEAVINPTPRPVMSKEHYIAPEAQTKNSREIVGELFKDMSGQRPFTQPSTVPNIYRNR